MFLKEFIMGVLFSTGMLASLALGKGMGANLDNDQTMSILIVSGIMFGAVLIVLYKQWRGDL